VYSSLLNGVTTPGALNIQFDIPVSTFDNPVGNCALTIWGIPLQEISNAFNQNGKNILIKAGFQKGLPLATVASKFSGPIFQGQILQCFGNWQGTEMTLNFMMTPGLATKSSSNPSPPLTGDYSQPFNGFFYWPAGTSISSVIVDFFNNAMPGSKVYQNLSPNLVLPSPQSGVYKDLSSFSEWLRQFTKKMIGGNYTGVTIQQNANGYFVVLDGTNIPSSVQIAQESGDVSNKSKNVSIDFTSFIGQPTWIDVGLIQFKCAMRSDININDTVLLPSGYYGIASSNPFTPKNYRDKLNQNGLFQIISVRHVGSFRQPDANSWVTVFEGVPVQTQSQTGAGGFT
jgi:hypothetical protein